MRIAIFTDTFLPQTNGVITAILNLSKGLADRGHKVFIVTPKYSKNYSFKYKNIKIKYIKGISSFVYEDTKMVLPIGIRTLNFLRKNKVELIHFNSPWTTGLRAIFSSKLLKLPLVGTYHTFIGDPENLKHVKLNYKFIEKETWKYTNLFYNRCDLVTTPSEYAKTRLIKNKCKRPIKVVSNGVEFVKSSLAKSKKIKEKYNKNNPLLLFVGRLAYEKNLLYLVDCFKLILKQKPKSKLLIVGDGPERWLLENKIKKEKLKNKIILTGNIDYNKFIKEGYYLAADLFVTTSKSENCPLTILEAQAKGLVCVGVNAGGVPYLVKNNVNGLIVSPNNKKAFANAVVKLLDDKKLYNKFKRNTLKLIGEHKISKVIDKWEKIYSELISKNKKLKTKKLKIKKLINKKKS